MKLIKLNYKDTIGYALINPDSIAYISKSIQGAYVTLTTVTEGNNDYCLVKETPEQIKAIIEDKPEPEEIAKKNKAIYNLIHNKPCDVCIYRRPDSSCNSGMCEKGIFKFAENQLKETIKDE